MSEGIYIRTVDLLDFILTTQFKHYFICRREMRSGRSIRLRSRTKKKINPKRLKRIHNVLRSVTHGRGLGCYQAQITAAAYAWSHSASLLNSGALTVVPSCCLQELQQVHLTQLSCWWSYSLIQRTFLYKMNMKEVTHVLVLIWNCFVPNPKLRYTLLHRK